MKPGKYPALLFLLPLVGCGTLPVASTTAGRHLDTKQTSEPLPTAIPKPVLTSIIPREPRPAARPETYSVVVNNVPVHDLLFALARDAKVNVDIHPGLSGLVTLNAINQTLPQLLARISKQVDMRWEMDGASLAVMPDKPYLRTYQIDFLNMSRAVKSNISTATQIASAAGANGVAPSLGQGGNSATTQISSETKNDLLESLIQNVTDMLREEDKLRYRSAITTEASLLTSAQGDGKATADLSGGKKSETTSPTTHKTESQGTGLSGSGSGNQSLDARGEAKKRLGEYEWAVSVFANKETGVLIVRATSRQHEKVREFIDQVMRTAKRQVLIEATIAEVTLSDGYKQGINWSALPTGNKGFTLSQAGSPGLGTSSPLNIFTLTYKNASSQLGNLAAEIDLLKSFGNVRVLSSPKLTAMNNQTATLKVADSKVYFTVKADTTTNANISTTTYTTTPNAVSIGFIMNVTPQITDADEVTLNIRPTITRITGYVNDPNPALATANIVNRVPEIQTREMESIVRIPSGQVAVMGGLMQDEVNDLTDAVPAVSEVPFFGELFKHRNDHSSKTELVIFLRPVVIKDASLNGDYSRFRSQLPDKDFFEREPPFVTHTPDTP